MEKSWIWDKMNWVPQFGKLVGYSVGGFRGKEMDSGGDSVSAALLRSQSLSTDAGEQDNFLGQAEADWEIL